MEKKVNKIRERAKKKKRIRGNLKLSSDRPRLCVYKSSKHIYAQIIDDMNGKVLTTASTESKDLKNDLKGKKKGEQALKVGELIAKFAKEKKIEKVVFDRSGYIFHGRIKALADGARKGGLKF